MSKSRLIAKQDEIMARFYRATSIAEHRHLEHIAKMQKNKEAERAKLEEKLKARAKA